LRFELDTLFVSGRSGFIGDVGPYFKAILPLRNGSSCSPAEPAAPVTLAMPNALRREYRQHGPHGSLGYKPPAPETRRLAYLSSEVVL